MRDLKVDRLLAETIVAGSEFQSEITREEKQNLKQSECATAEGASMKACPRVMLCGRGVKKEYELVWINEWIKR